MKILKDGNLKLNKEVKVWTLPRTTCIGATQQCKKYCYAKKLEWLKAVINNRNTNYQISLLKDFPQLITIEITYNNIKYVRIHEAGDFYNQRYVNKWKTIAKLNPKTIFLAYTKSLNLDLYTNKPKNLIIFQSYGGKHDKKIDKNKNTARVVISKTDIKPYELICPYIQSDYKKCGKECKYCYIPSEFPKHVAFILH